MKRNGHYGNGKQRWYCSVCRQSSSHHNLGVKRHNTAVWFKKWLQGGYTVSQLETISGYSGRTLFRLIHKGLQETPPTVLPSQTSIHLIFDGTFLYKRTLALGVFCDEDTGKVVAWRYGLNENSLPQLLDFFTHLREEGLTPFSCTVDGNPHVITALHQVWPALLVQRCLIHVQRQGLMWCRVHPKTTAAKHLRKLFVALLKIRTQEAKALWVQRVLEWDDQYKHLLEGAVAGWVMSDLKRARSMLLKALPNLFHFLDNKHIPRSTNRVEGLFSKLKVKKKRKG